MRAAADNAGKNHAKTQEAEKGEAGWVTAPGSSIKHLPPNTGPGISIKERDSSIRLKQARPDWGNRHGQVTSHQDRPAPRPWLGEQRTHTR